MRFITISIVVILFVLSISCNHSNSSPKTIKVCCPTQYATIDITLLGHHIRCDSSDIYTGSDSNDLVRMLLADSVFSSLISYSTAHGVAIGNPYSVILYTRGNVRHNHAVIDDSIIGIGAFYVDYGQRSLVLKTWRRVDGMFVELREIEAEVSGMINNYLGSIADDVLSQGSYKSNSILHVFSKSNVDTMRRVSKTFEYRLSHDHDTFYDKLTEYKKHMK